MDGLTLSALRGRQGDRVFYLVLTPNRVLNNFFSINMEPLNDRSQRTLDPKHAREITEYIVENPGEYVLGGITYAVDVEGHFKADSPSTPDIGKLTIPLDANLRSLDGQHRRQGLKDAIDQVSTIADDYTAVLIYVEPEHLKRRQMFSDMNATPKVVAKALNISFDTRDPFSRAATKLATTHPLLVGRVEMEGLRVRAGNREFFSLAGIYDAVKRLVVGPNGRVRNPSQYDEDSIIKMGTAFFDLLQAARPEFAEAQDPEKLDAVRSGTVLFSSTTLRVIAGAIYMLHEADHGTPFDLSPYKAGLEKVNFKPSNPEFIAAGFVTTGKNTPNARNQEVVAATELVARNICELGTAQMS